MSKQRCEECKYSYQFGSPLWSKNELMCNKLHDISWVNIGRLVYGKNCRDYENKVKPL